MRIAVVAHLKYPIAEPFAGGLEMHTHLLVRHLRRRGHAVTLFAAEGSDPALQPVTLCPPTGTPVSLRDIEDVALVEHAAYIRILGALATGGFDVIHNNALHYLPLTLAHVLPAPMLTVLHTPPFAELGTAVAERHDRRMRFLAVSAALQQVWLPLLQGAEVVGNGIDLGVFHPGPPPGAHAIWFGRIVPEKGLHLALDAARQAGMALHFAGPRSDPVYWRSMILPRLGEGVTDLGHLDHAALSRAVAGAAVSVCTPCWEEPYGLVVAEALACGTPVAGFARGALPDILDAGSGCLAAPGDVAGLARAMRAATALSRQACRQRAEAFCDAERMVAGYEAAYGRLLRDMALPPASEALDPV
ncbi:glycosyltransferase family 4 protein [Roseomonas sp. 18066]|uniref:glycosyltransferase family 4 protein n=1 Tax=Roseomonas sp. 18066 TaxID=2681412 RepID=UPI00135C96AD|nr:glycosyltransferase family 4 protein [Roseomonas sp. 18066]